MSARWAWVAVIVQLAAVVAHAQPAPPAELAQPAPIRDEDDAQTHLDRGIAAYGAHDFPRAMDELSLANRLAPEAAEPLRWLALTQAELDDCRSALANIDSFAARVPRNDPRIPELVALRSRCLQNGRLSVDSAPRGAQVSIDGGRPIATTPVKRLAMRAGRHTVTVELPGFEPQSHEVEVGALRTDYTSFSLVLEHETSITRRWWFWVAIGALAITAGGITYGVLHDGSQDGAMQMMPAGPPFPIITCTPTGCRP